MAMNLTMGGVFMYFIDTGYFQGTMSLETIVQVIMTFVVPILVYYAVVPRYEEMYPHASFLRANGDLSLSS